MSNITSFFGMKSAIKIGALVALAASSAAVVATPSVPTDPTPPSAPVSTPAPASSEGASSSGGAFFVAPTQVSKDQQAAQNRALASTEVPEPGMIGLFGAGLIGLAYARMRRRKLED